MLLTLLRCSKSVWGRRSPGPGHDVKLLPLGCGYWQAKGFTDVAQLDRAADS